MENARGALTNRLDIDPNTVEEDQNFIIDMYRDQPLAQAGSGPTSYTQDIDQGGGGGGALNSTPPPSAKGAGSNTPVEPEARQQQGGGVEPKPEFDVKPDRGPAGNAPQRYMYDKPDETSKALGDSYEAMQKYRRQRQARADAGDKSAQLEMELFNAKSGINGEAAREEVLNPENGQIAKSINRLEEDNIITEEQAKSKRWALKNIYRHVKPEEMGLFLMDFGLRAMMAGENMGDLGALGAAGSGAMGALQERRRYADEQGIAAGERAAEDMRWSEEQALEGRKVASQEKKDQALADYYKRDPSLGKGGQLEWKVTQLRQAGVSEETIQRIIAGADTYDEISQRLQQDFHEMVKQGNYGFVPEGGTETVYYDDLSRKDQIAAEQQWIAERIGIAERVAEDARREKERKRAIEAGEEALRKSQPKPTTEVPQYLDPNAPPYSGSK